MIRRWIGMAIGLGLLSGMAAAQTYDMAKGRAVVDGVVAPGEWDHAYWMSMDTVYHGDPTDLTNATWAALWDPGGNDIYVVLTATDTDHVMHVHSAWNGQDGLELYINARNDDTSDYGGRQWDYAQQWVAGWDPAATSVWVRMGGGTPVPSNARPDIAFGMVGHVLTYEFRLRPFDYFDYADVDASTEIPLSTGVVVGLDVVINSRSAAGFGMLCENAMVGKYVQAGALRDHRLSDVGAPPTSYRMSAGRAVVDGVLRPGEWDGARWMALDTVYDGNPVDVSNAQWAALWNHTDNALYVAVTGTDTDHVMHAYAGEDKPDGIELYVNARNDDTTNYAQRAYDYAQHWAAGWDPAATSIWVTLGDDAAPSNARPEVAFGMASNDLTYEVKLRPFDYFGYTNAEASTEIRLTRDAVIGLDVLLNSSTTGGAFGVLCENAMTNKHDTASNFRDHRLLPPRGMLFTVFVGGVPP